MDLQVLPHVSAPLPVHEVAAKLNFARSIHVLSYFWLLLSRIVCRGGSARLQGNGGTWAGLGLPRKTRPLGDPSLTVLRIPVQVAGALLLLAASPAAGREPGGFPARLRCPADGRVELSRQMTLGQLTRDVEVRIESEELCEVEIEAEPRSTGLNRNEYDVNDLSATLTVGKQDRQVDWADLDEPKPERILIGRQGGVLRLGIRRNYYPPRPLSAEQAARTHRLTMTVTGRRFDPRLRRINDWFRSIGVGNLFEAIRLCDLTVSRPTDCADLAANALKAGRARTYPDGDPELIEEDEPLPAESGSAEWRQAHGVPSLLVSVRSAPGRFELRRFDAAFEKQHGASLWELGLVRLSMAAGLPSSAVLIDGSVYCSERVYFMARTGELNGFGSECMSAASNVSLPGAARNVRGVESASVPHALLGPLVDTLLKEEFAPIGGRWTYLERDDNFAEVMVRNLKGHVIRNGRYWELLRLNFLMAGSEHGRRLRLITEGSIAASMGAYPPDTQFTESMDMRYGRQLDDFTRCVATRAREIAETRPRAGGRCGR